MPPRKRPLLLDDGMGEPPTPPKPSPSLAMRLEEEFKQAWLRAWPGVPLVDYHYGRDRKILKDLGEKLGEDGAVALIADFFEAVKTDPEVMRGSNPNVPWLQMKAQHLLLRKARRRPHARTAENIAEAKKAMGKA